MGPEMLTVKLKSEPQEKTPRQQAAMPAELAEVALIDAKICAVTGGMSVSQWHNLVREGAAPKPVVRLVRYTRWRTADVRQFFVDLASKRSDERDRVVIDHAKKASQAAKVKRQQKALNTPVEAQGITRHSLQATPAAQECGSFKEQST